MIEGFEILARLSGGDVVQSSRFRSTAPPSTRGADFSLDELRLFHQKLYILSANLGNPVRIFIVGSCVSRDAFNFTSRATLTDYVARTSLASAFGEPFPWLTNERIESALESKFQRRLVQIDASKKLRQLLETAQYDLVLLDLIDERFSLVKIGAARCTYSSEARKTGVANAPGAKFIRPSDELRHQWWKDGLNDLLAIAAKRGTRVVLNQVWWAASDDSGAEFDRVLVSEGNAHLARLYREIPESVERVSYDAQSFVGSTTHRWGRSPFHYTETVSHTLLSALQLDS
ncbi:MAG: DUF6270 domain-containing protein [Aliihoeflea sp.]|uniref:DUF6270 domain-containing protein n=1 Tax=Aliihoeflea sp. TaxID=2608088 RepID=UPI0040331887